MEAQPHYLNSYKPSFLLKNSHLMTIFATMLPRALGPYKTESILIPLDNESVLLAHAHISDGIKRCLVIVHGLEGSSNSAYVIGLTAQALSLGFNVVRLNLRNCGNTLHLTPTLYNAGQSSDLIKVVHWLKEKKGQSEQYLVGYSLGGNLVLKALAELGDNLFVKGGCAVSPSIDLAACVDSMDNGFNKIYGQNFIYSLKKTILRKHKLFPTRFNLKTLAKVSDMRSFDNLFTAPDAGFSDAEHYYRESSAKGLIEQIKINTLIIAAQDDPIVPFKSFANIDNTSVQLLAPKHGGHVSFLSNSGFGNKESLFWADNQILLYCLQQDKIKETNFV
jgi:uncharacterized protein